MLEIKNISKTYRSKSGDSVRALDRISLTFGETGMVFLLGKSGSGKSTLLNVIGGLDSYDEGEVIIKGRSSKNFKKSDFDAYRNTFIGFIFQDYNILEEFSVGANIALALELQGKKATEDAINNILGQVELLDYANRKPNELSGGQKQRIAIARALIKEPEIIMADEPTGALDSTTGKQVLETLKKLSKTKLVLVVSHDREFADTYGDRIIELADGRVISDMTQTSEEVIEITENELSEQSPIGLTVIDDSIIHISRGYTLTLDDMDIINSYLRRGDRDIILSKDEGVNEGVRVAKGLVKENRTKRIKTVSSKRPTGTVETKKYNSADTKFIKSKLPIGNATKIAAASMRAKPVRLIFTIFLSIVAFFAFGVADTMAAYNQFTATVDSLRDSKMTSIALSLRIRSEIWYNDNGEWKLDDVYYTSQPDNFNDDDIKHLEQITGLEFKGVYNGSHTSSNGVSLNSILSKPSNLTNESGYSLFPTRQIGGITELTRAEAEAMGFTLVGDSRYPENANEILIPEYIFRMMDLAGVKFGDYEILPEYLNANEGDLNTILGRKITMYRCDFTIVGVIDTGFDFDNERYTLLQPSYSGYADYNKAHAAQSSLEQNELPYSYHTLAIGFPGVIETLPMPTDRPSREYGADFRDNASHFISMDKDGNEGAFCIEISKVAGNDEIDQFKLIWLDDRQSVLGAKQIVIPLSFCYDSEGISASDLGYTAPTKIVPDIIKDTAVDHQGYTMFEWLFDSTYETAYPVKDGKRDITRDEYRVKICEFYNAYFGVNLPTEYWMYFPGNVLGNEKVNMGIDEYTLRRTSLKFLESNLDKIFTDNLTVGSEFYTWLCDKNEGNNPLEEYSETQIEGITLIYAYEYISESTSQKLFGSNKSMVELYDEELEASKKRAEAFYKECFGIDLPYDSWRGLLDNCYKRYFNGSIINMTLSEYVKERESLGFVIDNFDAVKEAYLDKNSHFSQWLGIDVAEGDSLTLPEDDYELGRLIANAVTYVIDNAESSIPLFGKNFSAVWKGKLAEYAAEGVKSIELPLMYHGYDQRFEDGSTNRVMEKNVEYRVVGYFVSDDQGRSGCVLSEELYNKAISTHSDTEYKNVAGQHESGKYFMVLATLPEGNRAVLETLATLHTQEENPFEFRMENNVTSAIDQWGETILLFNQIFFYVGIGFAVFAALMMLNFISASVTYKKKEIGILRAIGARSSDVFAIFFSEAFIIALINFALSALGVFVASYFINDAVRNELGFPITLLHAGIRQVLLVFAVSLGVAFVGSFFPVRKIARKNPIDAMKDR